MSNRLTAVTLREDLRSREEALKNLAPKTLRVDKFIAAAEAWVARRPEVLRCTSESIVSECLKAINDGLVFDGREAALAWFFDKKNKVMNAQYMPMVQGILKRLRELGDLAGVECEAVYQEDFFEVISVDGVKRITFKPNLDVANRGHVRAAYVVFKNAHGVTLHSEVMLRDEIENARKQSKNSDGDAWRDWYGEMARKTVIRRGSKYVPLSDEGRRIVNRDDDFTLLEGKALPSPRAEGDNPLADPSLEDFDDDGNLILPKQVDEPMRSPVDDGEISDAEEIIIDLAMTKRAMAPASTQTRILVDDVKISADAPLFEIPEEQPNWPADPLDRFAAELFLATTIGEATEIAARLRPTLKNLPRERLIKANEWWETTVTRIREEAKPAPARAPAPKKTTTKTRKRA